MERSEVSKTINVIILAFLVLFLIFHKSWTLYLAVGLLMINIFIPTFAAFLATYWMKFAGILGTFNSKVILTLTYYLFVTPFALLYRVFNKDLLNYFYNKNNSTFYKNLKPEITKEDFEKMW